MPVDKMMSLVEWKTNRIINHAAPTRCGIAEGNASRNRGSGKNRTHGLIHRKGELSTDNPELSTGKGLTATGEDGCLRV